MVRKIFVLSFIFLLTSCSIITKTPPSDVTPTTGKIISPRQDEQIQREFSYEVEILNPNPEKYYYLANEIGGNYWPKTRIHPPLYGGGRVDGQSNEGGNPPNGVFYIVLFEVDEKEHERIKTWFGGSDFSGLQIEGKQLDRIKVMLK